MTPAEKRVKELIDRWITSLDLHLQYVELNDSAYNNVQPWPVHDRPTRWVLELAKQKALEMQAAFDSRLAMGDHKFAESMELMVFLATLVGIQHVQRYIPLADPERHGQGTLTELDGLKPVPVKATDIRVQSSSTGNAAVATPRAPLRPPTGVTVQTAPVLTAAVVVPQKIPPQAPFANAVTEATREMPRPQRAAPDSAATSAKMPPPATVAPPTKPAAGASIQALSEMHNLVINDAVRLLNWGRPWHELAELVARIADRPKLPEVRRILRSHRAAIEMRVAEAQDEKEAKENK
jgi:hypothetical protein